MADSSIGNLTEKLVAEENDWLLLEDTVNNRKISRSNLFQVIDNLGSTYTYNPLSAYQGKVLNESKINFADIIDNLVSTYTYLPLSAYQGKILQDNKLDKSEVLDGLTYTDIDKALSANQGKILYDTTLKNTGDQVLSVSNLEGFKITSTNSGYYELATTNGDGNARNWRITSEYNDVGYFEILRSVSYGGTPDTVVLSFDKDGAGEFANYFTTPGIAMDKLVTYITTDTYLTTDSDSSLVTEKAVKSYIDYATRNYIDGLIMENDVGDTAHDIKVNIGIAKDYNNDTLLNLPSAIIKQIDGNWAEGNNQGGFPSGLSLTGSTWYHVFLIGNNDLSAIDVGYDTATIDTPINLQADATDYPYYRRIGSVLTDGSANIIQFTQVGGYFEINPIADSTTLPASLTSVTISSPLGVTCLANIVYDMVSTGTNVIYASGNNSFEWLQDVAVTANSGKNSVEIMTNTSSQIKHRYSGSAPSSYSLSTKGWYDFRGKQ